MTTNLARATKVIDRTAEKVGTRAPLLAQALKRAHLLVPDAPNPVEHGMTIDGGGTRADCVSVSLLCDFGGPLRRRRHARCLRPALGRWGRRTGRLAAGRRNLPHRKGILTMTAGLYLTLAISDHHPAGTCWAWMEKAEKACGRPEGAEPHLCPRHEVVARRRLDQRIAREAARNVQRKTDSISKLPKLRAQLAKVEAEIERRDPKPPTDDPAAFGGVGCTTTARWQKRVMSDSNISRMATLWDEQRRLAEAVRIAESWANS